MVKITIPAQVSITPASTVVSAADISVTTTATQLPSNNAKEVIIVNNGTNNIRIGDSSITATRGDVLKPGDGRVYEINNSDKLYHRTESGTSTLTLIVLN
jgi:hypothetical protein